ncbi:hypothetical protein BBJ29_009377 [Phytophthora kernoviae]|uniref:Uncharacterized protein n=1 Tax=Phytophthora kernoviae TaxID=325452 RepID=A0A3F2RPT3_9STRA|nr:hypothetical protein BBJ29_009377 [Phytophthora kernoviae]RLN61908.1 hypothetical protein BBP00_00005114 [Phytophthora kernoviae]
MVVYPKLMSTYATIRILRDELGCRLPIESWFRPDELTKAPEALNLLRELARTDNTGGTTFREINHPKAVRFGAKIYAIYNSLLEDVLFLDADSHPESTMFSLDKHSPVWELLDMLFVDMFELESGQLLIDRRQHAPPLELVTFYAWH